MKFYDVLEVRNELLYITVKKSHKIIFIQKFNALAFAKENSMLEMKSFEIRASLTLPDLTIIKYSQKVMQNKIIS